MGQRTASVDLQKKSSPPSSYPLKHSRTRAAQRCFLISPSPFDLKSASEPASERLGSESFLKPSRRGNLIECEIDLLCISVAWQHRDFPRPISFSEAQDNRDAFGEHWGGFIVFLVYGSALSHSFSHYNERIKTASEVERTSLRDVCVVYTSGHTY